MFFPERKLGARIRELANYRYRDSLNFDQMEFNIDESGLVGEGPPTGPWSTIRLGETWKGIDLYAWLHMEITIPQDWQGKRVVGLFDFGATGPGHTSGFESLLYLNGQVFGGVDSNHKEVFFPSSLVGQQVNLCFRLWSGLGGGGGPREMEHRIHQAQLTWLDEATDDLYFTAWALLEGLEGLPQTDPVRGELLHLLNRAFHEIDWSRPGSIEFYQSVNQAQSLLRMDLEKLEKQETVQITCIGHTHIDLAWLWRLKHTREKAARSFSTVLRLMELYPEYIFVQSQPQLYEYIREDYPQLYERIRRRVSEGRWEAGGAMWVEADCNIISGESLVRQILLGKRFFSQEFGVENDYLWLPDVFGYSWALPQILRKSGVHTFMTTKISWNQYNRMPHDTFWWRGIDGTEVLTHFISTPTPYQGNESWFYTYNGEISPKVVAGTWRQYQDKEINQELLLAYGYGDGGGGVNREMLELRSRIDEIPGLPRTPTGRADQYFHRLHQQIQDTPGYVHTWNGELYLEYHRGTYTSQAYTKRMNRKLELLYRETEWMSVMAALLRNRWGMYPQMPLTTGWKIILRNQFHDIIPGSSIREVYEDSAQEYGVAQELAQTHWQNAADSLVAATPLAYTIFNSANWERTGLVCLPEKEGKGTWLDSHGRPLPSQFLGNEWLVRVQSIPAMGFTSVVYREGESDLQPTAFSMNPSGICTPFYEIQWNESGQLVRVFDRENQREVLSQGERANVFQVFEDKPLAHDAWDIDLYYQEKMREIIALESLEKVEEGPLRCVLRFTWRYMDSLISQDLVLYSDDRRIDFVTHVHWQQQQQLLKVAFPVAVHASEATYDIQFGNVRRPTHWNTSWDYARFESVGHQWVDLSERGYGVSLLNDCKYGHDIRGNCIRLSLIKSAIFPDPQADQGEHQFTYSLVPHAGDWCPHTVRAAWELNNPLSFCEGMAPNFSLVQVAGENVMIDAVKKSEDGQQVILRLHEFGGGRERVEITSDLPIRSWQEADLMETGIAQIQSGPIFVVMGPYEIKTLLLDMG